MSATPAPSSIADQALSLTDRAILNQCFASLREGPVALSRLAQTVNVAPSAVQSLMRPFVALGVLIDGLQDGGTLSFSPDLELLDHVRIQQSFAPRIRQLVQQFDVHSVVGSTNDLVLASPLEPGAAAIALAEMQVVGRGRRGHVWRAEPFRNICMSVGYKLAHWPQATPSFALAAAVAVGNVIETTLGLEVKIKWPNDLLVNQAKLGGILVEATGAYGQDCLMVVGLGLNLRQSDDSALVGSDYKWASLADLSVGCSRNELIAHLIESLLDTFILFEQHGFAPFAEHWQTKSAYHNKLVRVEGPDYCFSGWQRGVDANGALLVEDFNNITHIIDDAGVRVREIDED